MYLYDTLNDLSNIQISICYKYVLFFSLESTSRFTCSISLAKLYLHMFLNKALLHPQFQLDWYNY